MSKWFGKIGFISQEETRPGVWSNGVIERSYFGDVIKDYRQWHTGDKVNDDLTISNQISILADMYANASIGDMKYVEFMGTKWKISSVEIKYPRLILSLGDVYNG